MSNDTVVELRQTPATKKTKKAAPKKEVKKAATKEKEPEPVNSKKDKYGFRPGCIKSRAADMYCSEDGATLAEIKNKTGSTQYNVLKELEKQGYTITKKFVDGRGARPIIRFWATK